MPHSAFANVPAAAAGVLLLTRAEKAFSHRAPQPPFSSSQRQSQRQRHRVHSRVLVSACRRCSVCLRQPLPPRSHRVGPPPQRHHVRGQPQILGCLRQSAWSTAAAAPPRPRPTAAAAPRIGMLSSFFRRSAAVNFTVRRVFISFRWHNFTTWFLEGLTHPLEVLLLIQKQFSREVPFLDVINTLEL